MCGGGGGGGGGGGEGGGAGYVKIVMTGMFGPNFSYKLTKNHTLFVSFALKSIRSLCQLT